MKSKTINVVSTTINGRKNYVAAGGSKSSSGKYLVNFTIDAKGAAKEFESLQAAAEFIPLINNPHNRVFIAHTETLQFDSVKEFRNYERIL